MPAKLYWSLDPNKRIDFQTGVCKEEKHWHEPMVNHYWTLGDLIYRCCPSSQGYVIVSPFIQSVLECCFNFLPYRTGYSEVLFGLSDLVGCLQYHPGIDVYMCPQNEPDIIYVFEESEWEHSLEIKIVNAPLW